MSFAAQTAQVGADYVHVAKVAVPGPSLALESAVLKWYDVAPADAPVSDEIQALARSAIREGARTGSIALRGELGFVILHRCGQGFYFLLVTTWWNDNELWETVWAKDGEGDRVFKPWPVNGPHRPTFCVWELGAVCHEQQAWARYLRSSRDAVARREYLQSTYAGVV